MAYYDYNDMISNNSFHISDFINEQNMYNIEMNESLNIYAKEINAMIESSNNYDALSEAVSDKKDAYSKSIKNKFDSKNNSITKRISEYENEIKKSTLKCQNIIDTNKKYFNMAITNTDSKIEIVNARVKIFNPSTSINYKYSKNEAPTINEVCYSIFGGKIAINDINIINKNKNKIPSLLKTLNSIVSKYGSYVINICNKFDNSNVDDILESQKVITYYMDIMDKVSASCLMFSDIYMHIVMSVIRINKENKPINESIDSLDEYLILSETCDTFNIYHDFNSIDMVINESWIDFENSLVKMQAKAIQSINEDSSDVSTEKKNIFVRIIDKLIELCKKIKDFVVTKWRVIRHKIANFFNYYGNWLDKNEKEIDEKFGNGVKIPNDVNIYDWIPQSYSIQITNLTEKAISQVLPMKSIDRTSPETYKNAVETFNNNWNNDFDIRRSLLKSASKTDLFKAHASKDASISSISEEIVNSCRSKKRLRNIDKTHKETFKSLLRNSKTWGKELSDSVDMDAIEKLADETSNDLKRVKQTDDQYAIKYYQCRIRVINIARKVINDLYNIQYRIHAMQLNNAMNALKVIMNSDIKTVNESITIFNGDSSVLKKFVDDVTTGNYENKDPENIRLVDKGSNPSDILSGPISDDIKKIIYDKKLSPIALINNNLILRSLIDHSIWIYYPDDKYINCEYSLYI